MNERQEYKCVGYLVSMKSQWSTWKARYFPDSHTAFHCNKQWAEEVAKQPHTYAGITVETEHIYVKAAPTEQENKSNFGSDTKVTSAPSGLKLPIVLALARCGIAHEPPTDAFLHQLRRLTESLSPDDAKHFKALLEWHDTGREKSTVSVVQSAPSERPLYACCGQPEEGNHDRRCIYSEDA